MYQEILSAKGSKISDTAMLILCIMLVLILEVVAVSLRNVAKVPVMLFQAAFVVGVIWFCIYYYKRRLLSIRYTLFTDKSNILGELCEKPEGFEEYENGSLLVENLMNPPGTFIAEIHLSEMKAYFSHGEEAERKGHIVLNATMLSKKTACLLVFEQDGHKFMLRFHPSKELERAIKEHMSDA